MKNLVLLLAVAAFIGCDSQTSEINDASTVIDVDGRRAEAAASISTIDRDGTAFQVVRLEMADGSRVEIYGRAFDEGRFVQQHEAKIDFPFGFSYIEAGDVAPIYTGRRGSIEIGVASKAVIEGDFEFATINTSSSCVECDASNGPKVRGHFTVARSVR